MAEVKMNDPVADQLRQQYPSNSLTERKAMNQPKKTKREKIAKVTSGKVSLQKEPLGVKIKKMFLPGDVKDIKSYALNQVIIPGVKNGVLSLLELAFFGEVRRRISGGSPNRTNYSYISSNNVPIQTRAQSVSQRDRATHNFQNILFTDCQDAENVISTLLDLIDRYGQATVADFYDAAGFEAEWTDDHYGWKSFQKLEARRVRDGYVIDVQPPIYLEG